MQPPTAPTPKTPISARFAAIPPYDDSLDYAQHLDQLDPLAPMRQQFHLPTQSNGEPVMYFCGNSLGLQPKAARGYLEQELDDWATLGVDAHFHGQNPWFSYHELFAPSLARLTGASVREVVAMNGLTVNLHLLMVSFYRPTPARPCVMMEAPAFPSDTYAVKTQIAFHGLPLSSLIELAPRPGEHTLRTSDILDQIDRHGDRTALLLLGGVNFITGQWFDMSRITAAAHHKGITVGWDLAHAVGNVPLKLHDWNVDFAAWCSYKYLNGGPGAVAGAFVHQRHGNATDRPRFGGWWGNDPHTRFRMHLEPDFKPTTGADGWQLSNPPVFALAPLRASLQLFDQAGLDTLRAKSERLTGYLAFLLERLGRERVDLITPSDPAQRGCQLSLVVHDRPHERLKALKAKGVVCDFREPNILRVAPVPLYNRFEEVWRFANLLAELG